MFFCLVLEWMILLKVEILIYCYLLKRNFHWFPLTGFEGLFLMTLASKKSILLILRNP